MGHHAGRSRRHIYQAVSCKANGIFGGMKTTRSKWRLGLAWLIGTVAGAFARIAYGKAAFDQEIGVVPSLVGAGALSAVMLIVFVLMSR